MKRFSTPVHYFHMEIDVSTIERIRITYAQNGKTVLQKEDDEISWVDNVAVVKLTQRETAMFSRNNSVEIQVRVLTANGDSLFSEIRRISCEKVLDEEVWP